MNGKALNADGLQAVAEREAAATPGPWIAFANRLHQKPGPFEEPRDLMHAPSGPCWLIEDADAEFVAEARQDVPNLLATIADRDERVRLLRSVLADVLGGVLQMGSDWSDRQETAIKAALEATKP